MRIGWDAPAQRAACACSAVTPSFLYQDDAAFSASFTLLMFFTPSSFSHASNALAPCLAYTGMPSFQVARPQSTPLKVVPLSPASARVSMNSALLTPAERYMNGLWVDEAAVRKCSNASAREYAFSPLKTFVPSTKPI